MSQPKTIALVANTGWYLYHFRRSLATELATRGFKPVFISPADDSSKKLLDEGFNWVEWKVSRKSVNPVKELYATIQLSQLYRRLKPSIIHHHTIKAVLYGTLAARLSRQKPTIINSITGIGYVFLSQDFKAKCLRSLVSILYRHLLKQGTTIFENQDGEPLFRKLKLLQEGKAVIIPGVGVDLTKYHYQPEPKEPIAILFAARYLKDKGMGEFIEALKQLKKEHKVKGLIAGQIDPANPASFTQAEINQWVTAGTVQDLGWSDMAQVFPKVHIVVLPSYAEGIPTVLSEAAASGKPIITTDAPGCREMVIPGKTGYLVPIKDSDAILTALKQLISQDHLRREMGKNASIFVQGRFDTTTIIEKTIKLYNNPLCI